jgi:hypothetical protein
MSENIPSQEKYRQKSHAKTVGALFRGNNYVMSTKEHEKEGIRRFGWIVGRL